MIDRKSEFFSSFEEAKKTYLQYKEKDPFKDIPPALLNSADISDYVRKTGMIYPFYLDDLRGATYDVRLKGLCVYYEEEGSGESFAKHIFCVGHDDPTMPNVEKNNCNYKCRDELWLAPNSITFVTLEPVFQVPEYLALRFNLKISHVYKGLLLGTGPIIDPGFQGRLSIPLHNLTSQPYVFHEGDPIITLEFTKMSPHLKQEKESNIRKGIYKSSKIPPHRQVTDYVRKATGEYNDRGIISSVVAATSKIKQTADDAKREAMKASEIANGMQEKLDKQGRRSLIIGIIAIIVPIVLAFFTLMLPSYQLIHDVSETQRKYLELVEDLKEKVENLEKAQGNSEENSDVSAVSDRIEDSNDSSVKNIETDGKP